MFSHGAEACLRSIRNCDEPGELGGRSRSIGTQLFALGIAVANLTEQWASPIFRTNLGERPGMCTRGIDLGNWGAPHWFM
ncbi:MAG: hypothetical protein CL933_23995 [Deltaproteobacteria bacterium]|nr:hypothetical protein [Deltaproteobacteria bacterium]